MNILSAVSYTHLDVYKRQVIELLKEIARRLINFKLFFIAEFAAAALLSVPLAVYFSVKKKSFFVFLLFAAMGAFTLAIPVVQGALYYRTCQPFGLFIAAVALFITEIFKMCIRDSHYAGNEHVLSVAYAVHFYFQPHEIFIYEHRVFYALRENNLHIFLNVRIVKGDNHILAAQHIGGT